MAWFGEDDLVNVAKLLGIVVEIADCCVYH